VTNLLVQVFRAGGICSLLILGTLLARPSSAHASQDDLRLSLSPVDQLLSGNPETGVHPLSATLAEVSLGIYPVGGDYHRWHGQLWADVGMLALGPNLLFHFGLSMQTVADYQNSIKFRLVRLYYDAAPGFDIRLGPGVLSLGYRHRCSHAADVAVPGRILIRSGFDLAYRLQKELGPLQFRGEVTVQVTAAGQNQDTSFQPRTLVYTTGGLTWTIVGRLGLLASAGIGVAVVGEGEESTFGLASPPGELRSVPLPAAAVGLQFEGRGATARLLLHYQRLLDSGNSEVANSTDLLAVRLEFAWLGHRTGKQGPTRKERKGPGRETAEDTTSGP